MSKDKKIWVISDTHFNHKKLINNGIRPSNFVDLIIRNLYEKVSENDMLIHLGDVTWSSKVDERFINLPCKKILVRGNHDKQSNSWYMAHGFDFSCDSFTLLYGGKNILFTHKPIDLDYNSFKYDYNICGHLHDCFHGLEFSWVYQSNVNYVISLENNDYNPELLDKIVFVLNELNKNKDINM